MKARLVRIGNSRGVRLPKPLIEQAGLTEDVELVVREGEIAIMRSTTRREGWSVAAQQLAARGGDQLLQEAVPTRFDDEEWEWSQRSACAEVKCILSAWTRHAGVRSARLGPAS